METLYCSIGTITIAQTTLDLLKRKILMAAIPQSKVTLRLVMTPTVVKLCVGLATNPKSLVLFDLNIRTQKPVIPINLVREGLVTWYLKC